jgi:hypothetical protein
MDNEVKQFIDISLDRNYNFCMKEKRIYLCHEEVSKQNTPIFENDCLGHGTIYYSKIIIVQGIGEMRYGQSL